VRTCSSGRTCLRVVDPDWEHPLDPAVSMARGGRWNPAGAFPVIYLNADLATARANARLLVEQAMHGMPFGFEDLDPDGLPGLIEVHLPTGDVHDACTPTGLQAAGLPTTYPRRPSGDPVPWSACQRVGARAHQAGVDRIVYRSAANAAGAGEVAWFTGNAGPLAVASPVQSFVTWFWDQDATGASN